MATTPTASQNFVQTPCTARDPRVAAAVQAVSMNSFPPLVSDCREMPTDATVRMLEDLQVSERCRVLVVEPFSGYLPELLGRLALEVTVVCADPSRAERLRTQLTDAGAGNVRVETFVQDRADDDSGFDRMVVMQPANEELGPVLQGQLAEHGRAVWSVDKSQPPRRVRRLLRVGDTTTIEEDLDLVHYMPLLGDMLVDAGVALRQEVRDAVVAAREQGRLLGEELLDRGSVREADLYTVLAEQQGRKYVMAADVLARLDVALVRQVPRKYLDYYAFLPVCAVDGKVWIVTPDIHLSVDEIASVFDDAEVVCELVSPGDLVRIWSVLELGLASHAAMGAVSGGGQHVPAPVLPSPVVEDHRATSEDLEPTSNDAANASTGGLLEDLLMRAVAKRATAVHLDASGSEVRVRHRIDGVLRDDLHSQLDRQDLASTLSAVASTEGAQWAAGDRAVAVRCAVHESAGGPSLTLHLLDPAGEPPQVRELGVGVECEAGLGALLEASRGLVLCAGPSGSGRSTTMAALRRELGRDGQRKLVTIDEDMGLGKGDDELAAMVAELEQHDADVLCLDMDAEAATVRAALRVAHRGRLVILSVNGNDTADVLQDLVEQGLSGSSIASSLGGVLVQHLAPRLCSACRVEIDPPHAELEQAFPGGVPENFHSCESTGCDACDDVGTVGRVPVVEFLPATPSLRRALRSDVPPHSFGATSRQNGLLSLRSSALRLLADGEVSFASVRHLLVEQ